MLARRLSGLVVLALAASSFVLARPPAAASPTPPPAPAETVSVQALPTVEAISANAARTFLARGPGPERARGSIRRIGFEDAPGVQARHVEIMDEVSGRVLLERDARNRVPIASVTKIMTAIVALERGALADRVEVRFDPDELRDSTLMGCQPGDIFSLEDLLYGLMLPSGNDAALAIANHIAGSTERFVELMNERARQLGLQDTRFANPHGLDVPDHYSTAHDMAVLARHAMQNADFRKLASAKQWRVTTARSPWTVYNLNRLLWDYRGADGIKIGFEDRAGRTIVASVMSPSGNRVFLTLLNTPNLVDDARPLYDWVFRNFTWDTTP